VGDEQDFLRQVADQRVALSRRESVDHNVMKGTDMVSNRRAKSEAEVDGSGVAAPPILQPYCEAMKLSSREESRRCSCDGRRRRRRLEIEMQAQWPSGPNPPARAVVNRLQSQGGLTATVVAPLPPLAFTIVNTCGEFHAGLRGRVRRTKASSRSVVVGARCTLAHRPHGANNQLRLGHGPTAKTAASEFPDESIPWPQRGGDAVFAISTRITSGQSRGLANDGSLGEGMVALPQTVRPHCAIDQDLQHGALVIVCCEYGY